MTRVHGKQFLFLLLVFLLAACNLTSAPEEQIDLTDVPSRTVLPTRTLFANLTTTPVTVTSLPRPTSQFPPTAIAVFPTTAFQFPTSTPMPVNIVILSPVPGSVVAGNVQVLGAAIHPQFLQYQLEWGPDPNPGNLWYPVGGVVQTPVLNGLLGIWNTTGIQDSTYQLRLRVFLRDSTNLLTVVNNIRIQNTLPTPIPTATTVPRPIAAFSQDRTTGQAPLVVRFINQSSGQINQYSWDFGDGGSSPEVNPVHTFRTPGIYTVQLRVRGPGGGSNVSRQINVQSPNAPVAGFTQDRTSGESPLIVQFTDQSTGNITTRTWNFGDGQTSNEVNPRHTFEAVGTYNVILTVTGPGGSSSVTRQITVQNPTIPAPLAGLVVSPATEGQAPFTVQLDASDSSGQIDTYNWTFGDGQSGNGEIITHTYEQPGAYEVTLTVVGPGGQATAQTTITVTQPPNAPTASFTAEPTSGTTPLTVNFNASASSGQIDSYEWDFGDGSQATGVQTSHTYSEPATYTVRLIVRGPGGASEATANISATPPLLPPEAAFTANPTSGEAPLEVQFTNATAGENLTFTWNFGDNTPESSERDPRHVFENPGNYTVRLRAQGAGGEDTAEVTINVSEAVAVVPPTASFTTNPTSGPAPLTVQLTAVQSNDITAYDWSFSDGGTASGANASYTFNAPGDYTVTLTVTGSNGLQDTEQTIISVTQPELPAPTASFTANPTSGPAPLAVQFDAQQADTLVDYTWMFSDGGTASGPSVNYTFNTAGTHTVTLTVTDNQGRTASQQTTIEVGEAAAPPPPDNALVRETPIIPDVAAQPARDQLSAIFQNGASQGRRAGVFVVVGDDTAADTNFLAPLVDTNIDLEGTNLRDIVEFYRQAMIDADGRSSLNHQRLATGEGWRAADLFDPARSNNFFCNAGEAPLDCELRVAQPAVVIISVGLNDALSGTDPNVFRATMEQIIQRVLSSGAIPVVLTLPPRPDAAAQIDTVNVAILEAVRAVSTASNTSVPVYNLWSALNELPNSGLNADNVSLSIAPSGAGDLHEEAANNFGSNRRNRQTMRILRDLREQIFPNAAP